MELRYECVKDCSGGAITKEVGVKEILALEDSLWVLFLDQVVQSIRRPKVLKHMSLSLCEFLVCGTPPPRVHGTKFFSSSDKGDGDQQIGDGRI